MRSSILALAACVVGTQAFKNTSPFALFSSASSSAHPQSPDSPHQPASRVLADAKALLKTCPSDFYLLVVQPSLSPADFHDKAMPHLTRALSAAPYVVSDVLGLQEATVYELERYIRQGCGEDAMKDWREVHQAGEKVVRVETLDVVTKRAGARAEMLRDHDAQIDTMLRSAKEMGSYTVIYTTTPLNATLPSLQVEEPLYEPEFESQEHLDLKRNLMARVVANGNATDDRPLFEKYQFFTPGIFMGLIVGIIMFMILSVGIAAVSSLQVSYAAFDKEMGPAAQKKQ